VHIGDVLIRDPRKSALANNGQARIVTTPDEKATRELRAELEMFVCDGQYGRAIERILSSYLSQLQQPRQNAAWVSGFFGSGKSHLLKMIGHLWENTQFSDGTNARSLVNQLPDEVKALLLELDTQAARVGKRPMAVAGSMLSRNDNVRLVILTLILEACDLPKLFNQAQFYFWLRRHGYLQHVIDTIQAAGKDWRSEINDLFVSELIAKALLECDPGLAGDRRELGSILRAQFPNQQNDISTDQFITAVREVLAPDGVMPLTVLILDEVQQYLGNSSEKSAVYTEVTEAIQTQLDSRVMLVASGQSALTATPHLQKLRDRFRITIQLTDNDVETVTRKVLLLKKPSAVGAIKAVLERYAGEISRHLQGTRLAEQPTDKETIVADYPLLPTRRRFWEECFRAVDAAGTHSQLRSQLRILDEALKTIAERGLGAVISADWLYQSIAADLVNTNVILSEVYRRIQEYDDGNEDGRLKSRLAGLIFLIGKLPREVGVDTGVRATATILSDLLVEDVTVDSGLLRHKVEKILGEMAAAGELMKIDDEYRIQTAEGVEWDRAFRERKAALQNNEAEIAAQREQLLANAVQKVVNELRLTHGQAKERRSVVLHAGLHAPVNIEDQVVVWLRDGWSTGQREVENEARRCGHSDPIIHVFFPRQFADELRKQRGECWKKRVIPERIQVRKRERA